MPVATMLAHARGPDEARSHQPSPTNTVPDEGEIRDSSGWAF